MNDLDELYFSFTLRELWEFSRDMTRAVEEMPDDASATVRLYEQDGHLRWRIGLSTDRGPAYADEDPHELDVDAIDFVCTMFQRFQKVSEGLVKRLLKDQERRRRKKGG